MDGQRDDERAPGDRDTQADEEALHVPQMTQQSTAATAAPPPTPSTGELTGTDALAADITAAWSKLDPTARRMVTASTAAFVLILIGLPLSVWDSAPFALLIMAATVTTVVTAWFGHSPAMRSMPLPATTIELMATHVAAILAIMKVIEIVFSLDSYKVVGLVIAVALAVALAIATFVMIIAATHRGADPLGAIKRGDQGTKIATAGLVLVFAGWVFNLSSFWTMGQAALPLAVLTIAALTIAEAPRIQSPVPVAWVGAAIAIFGALLVLGNWNELLTLGRTDLELDPGHFIGVLAYTVGTSLIIVGGILSGRSQWTPPAAAAVPATDASDDQPAV